MKKLISLILVLAIAVTAFTGCGASYQTKGMSAEELESLYAEAITGARSDDQNSAFSIMLGSEEIADEFVADMLPQLLGFTSDDVVASAVSVSFMITQAYGIVVAMPAEGKEETVKNGLQGFIDQQCSNFENYLVDQYDIAKNARLETLDDGTVVLVMSSDQDAIFESISKTILG